MQGYLTQDCRTKAIRTPRFDGHYYNCKKYGHRAFECKSKPMWTPNQSSRRNNYAHHCNWDYNTRQSCHYCQEYGHIPQNYNRWLNKTTCFSCFKTRHVSRNCPTKAKAPKTEVNKGKENFDVEYIKV